MLGHSMYPCPVPSSVDLPEAEAAAPAPEHDERVAVSRSELMAGILVGVGGEHDVVPTQEQIERAADLIIRQARQRGRNMITPKQLDRLRRYARDLKDSEPDISGDDNLSIEDAYNRGYADADVATGKALEALLDVQFNAALDDPRFLAAMRAEAAEPLPEEFLTLAREAHAEIEGHLAENPVPSPAASADTTKRVEVCGASEGATGITCDRYPGHQDWHSGKWEPKPDSEDYPIHAQWPRNRWDTCTPASSTFREGDREPQPDVRLVRGQRSGRTYERRSDGYGGHWDYRNGDGISWRVWEALLREERSVEVLPNTEQEAGK
jgi:hypothetical protein